MPHRRARAAAGSLTRALVALAVVAVGTGATTGSVGAQVGAPQRGAPFATVWMNVGEVMEVEMSPGFVGAVDSYSARSDNETAVRASTAGSTVSLAAVAEGAAFIEVTATNDDGSLSQWIGVVSQATPTTPASDGADAQAEDNGGGETTPAEETTPAQDPAPLSIVLASRAFCHASHAEVMGSEGESERIDRSLVTSFDLAYSVIGGRPPYVVTSPDGVEPASLPSGELRLACAVPAAGTGSGDGREYYRRRPGATAFALNVSDADGITARAEVVVHVSAGTTYVNNGDGTVSELLNVPGLANPGPSYVLGTPTTWTLVALVPGLDLRFDRLDSEGIAHFADTAHGWEIRLDWVTGAEVGRTAGATPDSNPLIVHTRPVSRPEDAEMMSSGPDE